MKTAQSTVAMSAYNVIARHGEPMQVVKAFVVIKTALDDTITQEEFVDVLSQLSARGLLVIEDEKEGTVDVADQKRRLVRWRDRTGDGWNNWMVEDVRGPQPLEKSA